MTLSPVFRSPAAVRLLEEEGVWKRLAPDVAGQARAVRTLHEELGSLIDERFLEDARAVPEQGEVEGVVGLSFLQEYFFLVLFRSIFRSLGVADGRLHLYSQLDFCIKGTITAADNLFDDQSKSLLPLAPGPGSRYLSILQLMCFERLLRGACDRAVADGILPEEAHTRAIQKGLMTRMAEIGELEGSEEGGVDEIPPPAEMVERVHRIRGGALFALAFVAPGVLESGDTARRIARAERAVARLGTAFQIVDDLTDFEFDLQRRSHNLLVSQIRHHGAERERTLLDEIWRDGARQERDMVEDVFRDPARAVLDRAYEEARTAFRRLADLGFWFPPELSDPVVEAIVGLDGVSRMESLTAASG